MNLVKTSNDSVAGKVAREIGVSFEAARDFVASPSSLTSSFITAAATAFLTFGISSAGARSQFNAFANGTAEGMISGLSFAEGSPSLMLVQEERKKKDDLYTSLYIASIFDSIDRAKITEEIIDKLMKKATDGTLHHEDVDRCIHDYMYDNYGPEFHEDPYYNDFRDGVKSQLRERNIQIVILDPVTTNCGPMGQAFNNRVVVAVIDMESPEPHLNEPARHHRLMVPESGLA